ncbi:hypothetical protein BGX29_007650 [Mortierella sp. GBA35]|nr:hypothetical protein BGX29_007650 [Mortierella sp. GBA35]
MIERTESLGYQIALVNVGGGAGAGAGVHLPGYRDGKRCIIDDVAFAAELWDRVKRHIPTVWEGRPVVGMNERLRFLKYHPNDQFAPHMDGEYRRTDGSGQVTKITIQFYLNSEGDIEAGAEAALRGGQTTFLDERFEYSEVKGGPEAFRKQVAVPCRTGQALVFQHDLVHEGSKVQAGIKYVVRTDILYGPRPNNYSSIRLGL